MVDVGDIFTGVATGVADTAATTVQQAIGGIEQGVVQAGGALVPTPVAGTPQAGIIPKVGLTAGTLAIFAGLGFLVWHLTKGKAA